MRYLGDIKLKALKLIHSSGMIQHTHTLNHLSYEEFKG